jgi:hypothetical protein
MKVQLSSDEIYYVDFQVKAKKKGNHTTVCIITKKNNGTDTPFDLSWAGESKCNLKDKYNKATGKAKALQRVLNRIMPGPANRNIRKLFWARFYECLQTPDISKLKGGEK